MSDQIERLIEAVKAISTNVQKTATYISANTYSLDADSLIEVIGLSGNLSDLDVLTELISSLAGSTSLSGVFNINKQLDGLIISSSGESAVITNSKELFGAIAALSSLLSRLEGTSRYVAGIIGEYSSDIGFLNMSNSLVGNSGSGSVLFGSLA
jgi:hypothetical protein